MTVTINLSAFTITIAEDGYAIVFTGLDLVRVYYAYEQNPNLNTVALEYNLHVVLVGEVATIAASQAPFARLYRDGELVLPLAANITNQPTWTTGAKDGSGAQAAINAIAPIVRRSASGGGPTSACPYDILIEVNGVAQPPIFNVDPCVGNTLTITI